MGEGRPSGNRRYGAGSWWPPVEMRTKAVGGSVLVLPTIPVKVLVASNPRSGLELGTDRVSDRY